jgi:hypothetical protein
VPRFPGSGVFTAQSYSLVKFFARNQKRMLRAFPNENPGAPSTMYYLRLRGAATWFLGRLANVAVLACERSPQP